MGALHLRTVVLEVLIEVCRVVVGVDIVKLAVGAVRVFPRSITNRELGPLTHVLLGEPVKTQEKEQKYHPALHGGIS
jgi:hypothetical protein